MDAETWMNAQKAIELGFADGVLTREAAQPEDDIPVNSYQFSRRAVTNSLLSKLPKSEPKYLLEPLEQRLNLLKA
jgi:ATP-dependent Clp protease protease subunit